MVKYKASNVYNDFLMLDLKYILQEKSIKIHEFLTESTSDKKSVDRKLSASNIEQLLINEDVEQFSHLQMQYMDIERRPSSIKIE